MSTKNGIVTDSEIIRAVLSGDIDKYAVIVERYEAKLLRYGMFLLKDYDVAVDAVQESFIKAYMNLRSFNRAKQFSPWIYRILHNEVMNVIKRSKKITALIDDIADSNGADDLLSDFLIAKKIDKTIMNADVRKCLSKLDTKYREVLVLAYFEDLKYDEISDILRIPSSTVGVRIKRAKATLKKVCESSGVKYE